MKSTQTNGARPKLSVTLLKGAPSARVAYGKKTEDGWHWQVLSAVQTPGLIKALEAYISKFEEGDAA